MDVTQHSLIHHFLEESARNFPDKIACIQENSRTSYERINNAANCLSEFLITKGVNKGDRVVLLMENGLDYIISYYGILKTGAVEVSLSNELKPDGLKKLLNELEPSFVISSFKFERLLMASALTQSGIRALLLFHSKLKWDEPDLTVYKWEELFFNEKSMNPEINVEESDLACIIYTSGSTGKPKGTILSHKNIVSNTHSICKYLNISHNDIQMVVLPFFYVMGKSLLNTHFSTGGSLVINNKFAYPASVVKQMCEEKVTGFSGVPSTYAYLLHRSPLKESKAKLNSLRYCTQAGGHMSKQIKNSLRSALPEHTDIYIMYGATEASARLAYLPPDRFKEKMDSIGLPIPGVSIKILDNEGNELSSGEKGELVCNGDNIMIGYWKDEEATSNVLDYKGYHTGDLGYKDEEGYLYIKGRKDNQLKVGGHRINPQEIEDIFMETNLVMEVFVGGIPDEFLGYKLCSALVPTKNHISERQILSQCSKKLPKYKLPSVNKIVRSLPKNSNGKIDRIKCLSLFHKD